MYLKIITVILSVFSFLPAFAISPLDQFVFSKEENGRESVTVELQLMGVRLGTSYSQTKETLTKKYGAPKSWTTPKVFDMFLLDKKTESILVIFPHAEDPALIGAIEVSGTQPVPELNFLAEINLGDHELSIPYFFPQAVANPVLTDGYRHYDIPYSNYSIEAKNNKVVSFRIDSLETTTFKDQGKGISLSHNLMYLASRKKLLNPLDIDKLAAFAEDPLRPYCKKRYPLRLSMKGGVYVDLFIFKENFMNHTPATFLLDTGCSATTISKELCQKMQCKKLNKDPPLATPDEIIVSGGNVSLGYNYTILDYFQMSQSKILNILKNLKVDGVLGRDVLLSRPLWINLKQGYLCFPEIPIAQIATHLKFKKIQIHYVGSSPRTNVYVNRKPFKNYILDTGADFTSISKQEISLLNLISSNTKTLSNNQYGPAVHPLYDSVEVGWPDLNITQTLTVSEAFNDEYRVLGMNFLRHYILGLDLKANHFYLGE